jgi:hypothetical protein
VVGGEEQEQEQEHERGTLNLRAHVDLQVPMPLSARVLQDARRQGKTLADLQGKTHADLPRKAHADVLIGSSTDYSKGRRTLAEERSVQSKTQTRADKQETEKMQMERHMRMLMERHMRTSTLYMETRMRTSANALNERGVLKAFHEHAQEGPILVGGSAVSREHVLPSEARLWPEHEVYDKVGAPGRSGEEDAEEEAPNAPVYYWH